MAMQIDNAIETLKSTELYRPYLKEDTKIYNDPVASDLIEALLSVRIFHFSIYQILSFTLFLKFYLSIIDDDRKVRII